MLASGIFFHHSPLYALRQALSLGLKPAVSASEDSQLALGIPCLQLPYVRTAVPYDFDMSSEM